MTWNVELYAGVEEVIISMPVKMRTRFIKLLELMENYGANLGEPHTKSLGSGLFEIRAKSSEGIARGLFCYLSGKHIVVLTAFVKKSQKTPTKELKLAKLRLNEVKQNEKYDNVEIS